MRLRMSVVVAASVVPGPAARIPSRPVLGIAALCEIGSTRLILEV